MADKTGWEWQDRAEKRAKKEGIDIHTAAKAEKKAMGIVSAYDKPEKRLDRRKKTRGVGN